MKREIEDRDRRDRKDVWIVWIVWACGFVKVRNKRKGWMDEGRNGAWVEGEGVDG